VRTMAESGLTEYVTESWLSLLAPKSTPLPIISRLNREVVAILDEPDTQRWLIELGLEPRSSTPDECRRRLEVELEKWRPLVKASAATVD
jgi:tripartite-type tricarboxylate transporter receptor subunit TctC